MDKLNLKIVLNKQRADRDGKYPVRIRTCVKRKVKYYNTGVSVSEDHFLKGQIIKHVNRDYLNAAIKKKVHQIETDHLEGHLNIKKTIDFFEYSTKKIEQQKKKLAPGTYRHKLAYLEKVRLFKPKLFFSQITPAFLSEYEDHCRGKGNKPTTVWSSIKFIKTMVNAALNDGIIKDNPMKGYKMPTYTNPQREYLTDKEIKEIEKFAEETQSEKLKKVANWFLFSIYTGLRYDDIRTFDKKKIVGDRIILRTGKSKSDVSIKIHPKLKTILDKISPNVLPNQKVNDYLKLIAEACEINKPLSFHIARHSFSVYFLNHGGSMEALSKLLGHTNLSTTQIYGKITNLRLDAEIDKVFS